MHFVLRRSRILTFHSVINRTKLMNSAINIPCSKINGLQLIQICFGENEVIFHFTGKASIVAMSGIRLSENKYELIEIFYKNANNICNLLGKEVESCNISDKGLSVSFGDSSMIIDKDDSGFESFILSISERQYVV